MNLISETAISARIHFGDMICVLSMAAAIVYFGA